ncbi:polysaccharide deacetylase family protein [Embleya sp. NPDC001921]
MTTPRSNWPAGNSCVAVLTFALDGETPILAAGRRHADNAMAMTHQQFESRVAAPRLLRLLAEYDITATFFVPGLTAERWPHTVTAIAEAGHEIGHHSYSHRPPTELTDAEDRAEFERGLRALGALGIEPVGYRAPMWAATWRTPGLVREYGLRYDSSLMDDDVPYIIDTPLGDIAEIPPHWSLDDWEQYAYLPDPQIGYNVEGPDKALAMWRAELDAMRRHHCLFVLTNHGFLSGRAGRVEGLRGLIEHALGTGDVAFATAAEVADRCLADPAALRRTHQPYVPDAQVYPRW